MSHRFGVGFRRASVRELSMLVLGVALVVTGIGMAICGSLDQRGRASGGATDLGSSMSFAAVPWVPASPRGEQR